MPTSSALEAAEEAGLDLVEVSPTADPPVCKILDYGKYKFQEQKKKNEARKRQKLVEIKEIKLRPNIDHHDYEVKARAMHRFFEEGDKVKVTLRFRGGEMRHPELGMKLLDQVKVDFDPVAKVENEPPHGRPPDGDDPGAPIGAGAPPLILIRATPRQCGAKRGTLTMPRIGFWAGVALAVGAPPMRGRAAGGLRANCRPSRRRRISPDGQSGGSGAHRRRQAHGGGRPARPTTSRWPGSTPASRQGRGAAVGRPQPPAGHLLGRPASRRASIAARSEWYVVIDYDLKTKHPASC